MSARPIVVMPQCVQYGLGQPQVPIPFPMQRVSTTVPQQGAATNWGQAMPLSPRSFVASSGACVGHSQPLDEAQHKKLRSQELDHSKPGKMIHSRSAESLSTTASLSGNESWRLSCGQAFSCGSSDDSLSSDSSKPQKPSYVPDSNSAAMELRRTSRAQEQVRRWVSTAMNEKITCLEKELESRANSDRKNQKEKDVLDRTRSLAQMTRQQNAEERHKRQHEVYEEAQRIVVEKRQQALEKEEKWNEQVHMVLCDKKDNHQIRKDIQEVASRALESLNDKIHQQRVQSKINTEELRDHMTRCLSHKLFDPIPVEHVHEKMVSPRRTLHSSRSADALHSPRPRFEHAAPTQRKARAKSPQYRYRPTSALVPKPSLREMID